MSPPIAAATHDDRLIVLYDGVCALCNGLTRFVLTRDRLNRFRFAPLQSEFSRSLLTRHGFSPDDLDTFYLVLDAGAPTERLLSRARAALRVLTELGGAWSLAGVFRLLPTFILDRAYNFVARRRYAWFGRSDACIVPRPEWRHKFIE